MRFTRWNSAGCAALAALCLTSSPALRAEGPPTGETPVPPTPALTQEQFQRLHLMIRPQPGETPWLDGGIAWNLSLSDAQQLAARQGKPILIWHVGGAGYRDGLGRC